MAYRNPYTAKDLSSINAAIMSLADAQKLIDRAKAAGLDVGSYDTDCAMCTETLQRIKTEFFSQRAGDQ